MSILVEPSVVSPGLRTRVNRRLRGRNPEATAMGSVAKSADKKNVGQVVVPRQRSVDLPDEGGR